MENNVSHTLSEYNKSKKLDYQILDIISHKIDELILEVDMEDYKIKLEHLKRLLSEIYLDYENYSLQFETMTLEPPDFREEAFYHVISRHIVEEIQKKLKSNSPQVQKRLTELSWIIINHTEIIRELNARPFIR